ncbi:MAG: hypothetical protein OJJ54_15005 [Pseudonocardia sp.]|nr:hypothetical protein [Pseudonocardia sp.]
MSDRRTDPSLHDLDRKLVVVGAVLFAIAAMIGAAGAATLLAAVLGAGRSWVRRAELPPAELARLKWTQARAAAGAGAGAWRDTEAAHPGR